MSAAHDGEQVASGQPRVCDGAYETFSEAARDCMFLEVNDTTEKIWVNPDFKHASEEPE
jgi:hypothetical protein